MKQSKFSKRRPKGKPAYYPHQQKQMTEEERKIKKVENSLLLDEYDLGIFVDDERGLETHLELNEHWLPKCHEWIVLRNYKDVIHYLHDPKWKETVFISFDHYLSAIPSRKNGHDCAIAFKAMEDQVGRRVDVRGHSSDCLKNDEKMYMWYH